MAQFFWPPSSAGSDGISRFILDGVTTTVSQDTVTPANSNPLPVTFLDPSGLPADYATEAKQDTQITKQDLANTLLGEIADDILLLRLQVNSAGFLSQQPLSGLTPSTISVPANAVGCNIQAPSTNEQNIRVSIGSVASDSAGMIFEPGRSEVFNGAAAISACATVAGSNEVIVQWVLRS